MFPVADLYVQARTDLPTFARPHFKRFARKTRSGLYVLGVWCARVCVSVCLLVGLDSKGGGGGQSSGWKNPRGSSKHTMTAMRVGIKLKLPSIGFEDS